MMLLERKGQCPFKCGFRHLRACPGRGRRQLQAGCGSPGTCPRKRALSMRTQRQKCWVDLFCCSRNAVEQRERCVFAEGTVADRRPKSLPSLALMHWSMRKFFYIIFGRLTVRTAQPVAHLSTERRSVDEAAGSPSMLGLAHLAVGRRLMPQLRLGADFLSDTGTPRDRLR